jgi:hypothetical protein
MNQSANHNHGNEKATEQADAKKEVRFDEYREDVERISFEAEMRDSPAVDVVPTGEVSEVAKEDGKKKGEPGIGSSKSNQATTDDNSADTNLPEIEELRIPVEKIMIRQIRLAIQDEIKETQLQIKRLEKNPAKNAYELSNTVDMYRRLREALAELAYKSAEYIKNLYLDVMQGKSVREMFK